VINCFFFVVTKGFWSHVTLQMYKFIGWRPVLGKKYFHIFNGPFLALHSVFFPFHQILGFDENAVV